jgi:hypothetical protein
MTRDTKSGCDALEAKPRPPIAWFPVIDFIKTGSEACDQVREFH